MPWSQGPCLIYLRKGLRIQVYEIYLPYLWFDAEGAWADASVVIKLLTRCGGYSFSEDMQSAFLHWFLAGDGGSSPITRFLL